MWPSARCVQNSFSHRDRVFAVAGRDYLSETMSEAYVILGEVQRTACESGALEVDRIANMFGYRKNIVMVDNRCVIVTGASLLNAFERTEVLEYSAASLLAAYALGRPIALTEAEIQHTNQVMGL